MRTRTSLQYRPRYSLCLGIGSFTGSPQTPQRVSFSNWGTLAHQSASSNTHSSGLRYPNSGYQYKLARPAGSCRRMWQVTLATKKARLEICRKVISNCSQIVEVWLQLVLLYGEIYSLEQIKRRKWVQNIFHKVWQVSFYWLP